jgi:hypothetical protein
MRVNYLNERGFRGGIKVAMHKGQLENPFDELNSKYDIYKDAERLFI